MAKRTDLFKMSNGKQRADNSFNTYGAKINGAYWYARNIGNPQSAGFAQNSYFARQQYSNSDAYGDQYRLSWETTGRAGFRAGTVGTHGSEFQRWVYYGPCGGSSSLHAQDNAIAGITLRTDSKTLHKDLAAAAVFAGVLQIMFC